MQSCTPRKRLSNSYLPSSQKCNQENAYKFVYVIFVRNILHYRQSIDLRGEKRTKGPEEIATAWLDSTKILFFFVLKLRNRPVLVATENFILASSTFFSLSSIHCATLKTLFTPASLNGKIATSPSGKKRFLVIFFFF